MIIAEKYSAEDLQDNGLYLRGLLQIMAADDHLHTAEKDRIKAHAKKAGFEDKFIEKSIADILNNKHITRDPPKFHTSAAARDFLLEAAEIAVCDGHLHPAEEEWLLAAAEKNSLDPALIMPVLNRVPRAE